MTDSTLGGLAYSRPVATAARLGDDAPDHHRFLEKRVVLTGNPVTLASPNGRMIALTALRLLPRMTPHVAIWIPGAPETLLLELAAEAERIAFGGVISVSADPDGFPGAPQVDALLHVGAEVSPYLVACTREGALPPVVSITSNGWCVWVSRGSLPRIESTQRNPVAAVAAAALGVAEVFKIFIALRSERGDPADGTAFSLFDYSCDCTNIGPEIPEYLDIDAVLVGFGAIGNGIVAVIAELPLRGRLVVVDRQSFGTENLGTCVLIGPENINDPKPLVAERALHHLRPGLEVTSLSGDAETVLPALSRVPPLILNGLDNPIARREAQRLWADLTIDGAIGDFMCQVSRHPGDPSIDTACLRCLFPTQTGARADAVVALATGLRQERVLDGEDIVRQDDVDAAPVHLRSALRAKLGQTIKTVTCSVASEDLVAALSTVEQQAGFEPSVPFVAVASAAMVVGEMLKHLMGLPTSLDPRFQFDILRGPCAGLAFPEARHPECDCVQRRPTIERLRATRK